MQLARLAWKLLKPKQGKRYIAAFVSGNDVFVSLPIGHGKSFCYVLLPLVFDELLQEWFDCAFTLLFLTVVTMRFIAHLFNRNRVKHAT